MMTPTGIPPEFIDMCFEIARPDPDQSFSIAEIRWTIADDQEDLITSTCLPQYGLSKWEATCYYAGLPSSPILVYRTSTTPYRRPTGRWACLVQKELKPVFDPKIVDIWDMLGPMIHECLDSEQVMWTSIDVVHFAEAQLSPYDKKEAPGPIVLWIGVMPKSLSGHDAHTAAVGCVKLLESFELTDVEVEFRESVFTRSVGPQLLGPRYSTDATASVRSPLTPSLGLPIAAKATPCVEGTGALYISEGDNSEKVYILTARHVIFPLNAEPKELYNQTRIGRPRHSVILPGHKAFQDLLTSIMAKIWSESLTVGHYKEQLEALQGDDDLQGDEDHDDHVAIIQRRLKEAEAAIKPLNQFHDQVTKYWSQERLRVIGQVAYSPPISVGAGTKCYTEDWALIELDRSKIDWKKFKGNVVDLGTKIPAIDYIKRMCPNPSARTTLRYPLFNLVPLQGVIEEDELRRPHILDADNKPFLPVAKSGSATGLTIGHASGVMSFVREYLDNGTNRTSMEWAILPYDMKSRSFSAPGDSGAIIFDGQGRIGGMLTGGTGKGEDIDISYGTPFHWLMPRIKEYLPHADLYPTTA